MALRQPLKKNRVVKSDDVDIILPLLDFPSSSSSPTTLVSSNVAIPQNTYPYTVLNTKIDSNQRIFARIMSYVIQCDRFEKEQSAFSSHHKKQQQQQKRLRYAFPEPWCGKYALFRISKGWKMRLIDLVLNQSQYTEVFETSSSRVCAIRPCLVSPLLMSIVYPLYAQHTSSTSTSSSILSTSQSSSSWTLYLDLDQLIRPSKSMKQNGVSFRRVITKLIERFATALRTVHTLRIMNFRSKRFDLDSADVISALHHLLSHVIINGSLHHFSIHSNHYLHVFHPSKQLHHLVMGLLNAILYVKQHLASSSPTLTLPPDTILLEGEEEKDIKGLIPREVREQFKWSSMVFGREHPLWFQECLPVFQQQH